MAKYLLGQYRDRVRQNIEMVYQKVVKKAGSVSKVEMAIFTLPGQRHSG